MPVSHECVTAVEISGEHALLFGLAPKAVVERVPFMQPQGGRGNGAKGDNVVMRSVPSEGPTKAATPEGKVKADGKPKARVQTARNRRAAKQQVQSQPR